MRTGMLLVVFAVAAARLAAQPPTDPPPIVIKPKGSGDLPATNTIPDRPGAIIIRPNGKPATPQLVTQPQPPGVPPVGTAPAPAPVRPVSPAVPADKTGGIVLFDYWFAAAVEGQRMGYVNWVGREVEKDGQKLWTGMKFQSFTVARFGQEVVLTAEESTVETPAGEVLVTSFRQRLGKDQELALTGVVNGKTLKVTGEGMAAGASDTPWPGGIVGIVREPRLFKEKALKVGESFDYLTYVPNYNRVVKVTTTFEGEETTVLWPNTPARKLHRYTARMEKVDNLRLPAATTWCDAETAEPLRVEFDFPPLGGRVTFLRTTKEAATAPVGKVPDLFNVQSIRLDKAVPDMHARSAAVYKVSMPRDDEPGTAFPTDARQSVKNLDEKAKTLELHVAATRGPVKGAKAEPAPGPEFLGSSFFINWDNEPVKAHAARALAGLPPGVGAWDKARAVERWVNRNMRAVEFSQAMATADNVAKTLSGDCTEYAMLGTAMCRAAGVPSRTVLGLVYAPGRDGKVFLAYHMWFEVYAEGQWLPLDGTLGQGGVGPGHVKITDHSWHEEKTLAPLLPVLRVLMAKPAFEVLKVMP